MMPAIETDVVIAGAGIAGLALGIGLAKQGMSCQILEAAAAPPVHPVAAGKAVADWDRRVSALTPASTRWLDELGVWARMQDHRVGPYNSMSVWDGSGTGHIEFSAGELEVPRLGHIVENRVTLAALNELAACQPGLTVHWGQPVNSVRFGAGEAEEAEEGEEVVVVGTAADTTFRAQLLVGADGAQSPTRQLVDLATRAWSYQQHAIVATVALAEDHQTTCYQAFLDSGPLALLPLADPHICSIVWSLDDHLWESHMNLSDGEFVAALNRALRGFCPPVIGVSERAAFPLRQCHAIDYFRPGVALVGDAAHSIHPLAGQGVNLGLKDVAELSGVLGDAWLAGDYLGSAAVLSKYQRVRKGDNLLMMGAMEAFKRGFGSRQPLLRVVRNLGLSWTHQLTPLKQWLARQALA